MVDGSSILLNNELNYIFYVEIAPLNKIVKNN